MRVILKHTMAGPEGVKHAGAEVDLDEKSATHLINTGQAQKAPPRAKKAAAEPAPAKGGDDEPDEDATDGEPETETASVEQPETAANTDRGPARNKKGPRSRKGPTRKASGDNA